MTNREAMEIAARGSFMELYEKGFQDGKNEAVLKQCNHDLAVEEAYEHGIEALLDKIKEKFDRERKADMEKASTEKPEDRYNILFINQIYTKFEELIEWAVEEIKAGGNHEQV